MTEAERERAIRVLRERYAHGDLSQDAFDEKLDALFAGNGSAVAAPSLPVTARPTDLEAVERRLTSGEHVEWVGRPDASRHFTRGDVFLVPFSVLWGGFAIFWEATAVGSGGGAFTILWGIPFVAMGLYFIFGRFVYKANLKRRTIYAVTNRRVMSIVRGRRGESVDAMYLRSIPTISTSAVSNGRGSVEFGASSPTASWYGNSGMELFARGRMPSGVNFFDIEDPRGVAELVERLREADRAE